MKMQEGFALKEVTTLGIGGPAKKFVEVKTVDELKWEIDQAHTDILDFLIVGGCSNLLVSDQGFNGVVIKNSTRGIKINGEEITVLSGTPLEELVDFTIEHGLSGMEKLAGIPGTVGGAIFGNAGAYGETISDHLVSVRIYDPIYEEEDTLLKSKLSFGYRTSSFKRDLSIILEATFKLIRANAEDLKKIAEEIIEKRAIKYPPGIKCPGSFFKNLVVSELSQEIVKRIPQEKIVYGKIPAGALLEEVGAKGKKSGAIEIAPYHANLFINNGNGTAKDFYTLAKEVALQVKEKFGVELEPEVKLINLSPLF